MKPRVPDTCSSVDEMLMDFLYEELQAGQRRAVEQHLAHCLRCRESLARFRETRALFSRLPEVRPSPHVTVRILEEARRLAPAGEARVSPWLLPRWLLSPAFGAATALLLVVGVLLLLRPDQPVPQAEQGGYPTRASALTPPEPVTATLEDEAAKREEVKAVAPVTAAAPETAASGPITGEDVKGYKKWPVTQKSLAGADVDAVQAGQAVQFRDEEEEQDRSEKKSQAAQVAMGRGLGLADDRSGGGKAGLGDTRQFRDEEALLDSTRSSQPLALRGPPPAGEAQTEGGWPTLGKRPAAAPPWRPDAAGTRPAAQTGTTALAERRATVPRPDGAGKDAPGFAARADRGAAALPGEQAAKEAGPAPAGAGGMHAVVVPDASTELAGSVGLREVQPAPERWATPPPPLAPVASAAPASPAPAPQARPEPAFAAAPPPPPVAADTSAQRRATPGDMPRVLTDSMVTPSSPGSAAAPSTAPSAVTSLLQQAGGERARVAREGRALGEESRRAFSTLAPEFGLSGAGGNVAASLEPPHEEQGEASSAQAAAPARPVAQAKAAAPAKTALPAVKKSKGPGDENLQLLRASNESLELGNYQAALQGFQQLIRGGDPRWQEPARFGAARSLELLGRTGEAAQAYEELLRSHPATGHLKQSLLALARLYEQRGQNEQAQQSLQRYLARWPADQEAQLALRRMSRSPMGETEQQQQQRQQHQQQQAAKARPALPAAAPAAPVEADAAAPAAEEKSLRPMTPVMGE